MSKPRTPNTGNLILDLTAPSDPVERREWELRRIHEKGEEDRRKEWVAQATVLVPEYEDVFTVLWGLAFKLDKQAAPMDWSNDQIRSLVRDFVRRRLTSATSTLRLEDGAIAYVKAIRVEHPKGDGPPDQRGENAKPDKPRRRGRPPGTRVYHEPDLLVAEYKRVRSSVGRWVTEDEFCQRARPRLSRTTLTERLREFHLDWPPE